MKPPPAGHEPGGDRVALERHADELGLHADLDHEVRRHEVDVVAVAAPDQVEAGGERPQDAAAVAVELVVAAASGRSAVSPSRSSEDAADARVPGVARVVVVTGVRPVDLADALQHLAGRAPPP